LVSAAEQVSHAGVATLGRGVWGPAALEVVAARPDDRPAYAAVLEMRRDIFGHEQGIAGAVVTDRDDERSLHALAMLTDAAGPKHPVGTGRLTLGFGERGEALIAWVATRPEARGQGVGTAVMRFLLAAADEARAAIVVLSAQTHAEQFYRRFGFVPAGRAFAVKGIEHRWMARARPRSAKP
jgi:predicted GNAT family N-acyltransferase